MTLEKRPFQLFMKRLRKIDDNDTIRYYAVGEYGTKNKRPHYHAIMFNVKDEESIYKAWMLDGKPIGGIHIGNVSGSSIAYTAKYIDKPSRVPEHKRDDRLPEFSLMSKGLGQKYLSEKIIDYHRNNIGNNFVTLADGIKIAMPKYYRDKLFNDEEKRKQRVIIQREVEKDNERREREYFAYNHGATQQDYQTYITDL